MDYLVSFSDCNYRGRIEHIRRYIDKNPSTSREKIASHFGINTDTVDKIYKFRPSGEIRRDDIRGFILSNPEVSLGALREKTRVTYSTLRKDLETIGVELLPHSWHVENKILRYSSDGLLKDEIGEVMGLSKKYVAEVLLRLKRKGFAILCRR
jgi:hypothetical protein